MPRKTKASKASRIKKQYVDYYGLPADSSMTENPSILKTTWKNCKLVLSPSGEVLMVDSKETLEEVKNNPQKGVELLKEGVKFKSINKSDFRRMATKHDRMFFPLNKRYFSYSQYNIFLCEFKEAGYNVTTYCTNTPTIQNRNNHKDANTLQIPTIAPLNN